MVGRMRFSSAITALSVGAAALLAGCDFKVEQTAFDALGGAYECPFVPGVRYTILSLSGDSEVAPKDVGVVRLPVAANRSSCAELQFESLDKELDDMDIVVRLGAYKKQNVHFWAVRSIQQDVAINFFAKANVGGVIEVFGHCHRAEYVPSDQFYDALRNLGVEVESASMMGGDTCHIRTSSGLREVANNLQWFAPSFRFVPQANNRPDQHQPPR